MENEIKNGLTWASINLIDGTWEYMDDEDNAETYQSGGLVIENGVIKDYDGCFELPPRVVFLLRDSGIDCSILND